MKIRLLGTGYGECKIKKKSSKDFRKHGGVIVDERILLDAPEDIFDAAAELGFSDIFDKVGDVFITHSHRGHFSEEAILRLSEKRKIRVFASQAVLDSIAESSKIEKVALTPFMDFNLGDYRIIALPANHKTENEDEPCFNFLISRDKTLFYALDGGIINFDAFSVLREFKIDGIIADAALFLNDVSPNHLFHNGKGGLKMALDILAGAGIFPENGRFILTHIPSDRKRAVHEEIREFALSNNMTAAYDGYFFSM